LFLPVAPVRLLWRDDPFERANRDNHAFNKDLDRKILSPLSKTYADVVPDPVEDSVSNFASNLSLPGKVVNNVLQAGFTVCGAQYDKVCAQQYGRCGRSV
jgi:ABC-type transporter lipoprotein component MlaA